jgi:hypothetical protein
VEHNWLSPCLFSCIHITLLKISKLFLSSGWKSRRGAKFCLWQAFLIWPLSQGSKKCLILSVSMLLNFVRSWWSCYHFWNHFSCGYVSRTAYKRELTELMIGTRALGLYKLTINKTSWATIIRLNHASMPFYIISDYVHFQALLRHNTATSILFTLFKFLQ